MIKYNNYFRRLYKLFRFNLLKIVLLISHLTHADINQSKICFWNSQQKGTNIFNINITLDDIKAAKKIGIKFIRLAPDKFVSSNRDFLIGNADSYRGLIKEDLKKLRKILDLCQEQEMFVMITMLSLPGSRWNQNNDNKDDLRIWRDEKYQTQAALFWQDLAKALKDHPAVIGYNILNEPHPERLFEPNKVHIQTIRQDDIQPILYNFYNRIIQSIRSVDKNTPIILDSSAYADPETFFFFKPHADKNILYSFHMYEPYEYTNYKINQGKFKYPGYINKKNWNKKKLKSYMSSVISFQKSYNIQSNRILVGEFGGHRLSHGLDKYFEDLISIFDEERWHFAFYAFREDTWDGMDYELGDKKLPWSYWQAIESGHKPILKRQNDHPIFSVIKRSLNNQN